MNQLKSMRGVIGIIDVSFGVLILTRKIQWRENGYFARAKWSPAATKRIFAKTEN